MDSEQVQCHKGGEQGGERTRNHATLTCLQQEPG